MSIRRLILRGLPILLLLPFRLLATSVDAPAFDSLTGQADYVVRAVVKSVQSEWRENAGHRYIATTAELEVKEVLKGTPPSPLVLDMVGGRVGEDELVVEGAPKLFVGDENIFFVHGNGRFFSPLVGVMHGLYPIFRDHATGQEYVLRSNGMPLYSEQDVSLAMTMPSPVKTLNPAARPMTTGAFGQQVRSSALRQVTSSTREK